MCSRSTGPRTAPPRANKPAKARGRSRLIPTLCKSPPAFAPDEPVGEFTPTGVERGGRVSPDPKICHPTAPSQLCPSCRAAPGAQGVLRGVGKRLRFAQRSPGDGRCHRGELRRRRRRLKYPRVLDSPCPFWVLTAIKNRCRPQGEAVSERLPPPRLTEGTSATPPAPAATAALPAASPSSSSRLDGDDPEAGATLLPLRTLSVFGLKKLQVFI